MFQLLNGVRPSEGFSCLIVVSNEVENRLLQLAGTGEMAGLQQELAFLETEPDFVLIEPRHIGNACRPYFSSGGRYKFGPDVLSVFFSAFRHLKHQAY